MNNVVKGWMSTVLGVLFMLSSGAVGLGFVSPKTEVSDTILFAAFLAGFGMLFIPKAAEDAVRKLIRKKLKA